MKKTKLNEGKIISGISVLAFVGPAGTGKSERALSVARKNAVDYIIDDGLIIARGQIMTGKSAKTEKNMVRAIRRAIFSDHEHRQSAIDFITSKAPCKILILATSDDMVQKIVKALCLPKPDRIISISEVSTQKEIESALRERRENRQHTIPASYAQIQRRFAGKLVRQIKGMFKWGKDDPKTIVKPPFSFSGDVIIDEDVLYLIARYLLTYGDRVKKIKELEIESDSHGGAITLGVVLNISSNPKEQSVFEIAKTLQRKVRRGLGYFTGIDVKKVDIKIDEVSFNE
ncbi:MAG: hypothetical protein FWG09_02850 [Synergistaceae bacterium]|nr:hypothetical protein [Synergistaceae bacterium]